MTEHILIGSMRRSGGTLLTRLLDGHPECSVFPFENWHTEKKARFRWHHNVLFPVLSPKRKLHACGFHASYERKLKRFHPDSDWREYRQRLLEMATEVTSVREFYRRSSELYFRTFHSSPLRPKLVDHCASLCLLPPWQLRRIFGEHRLVLSVRDPRAAFCSLEHHRPERVSERTVPFFCRDWERSVRRYHWGDPSVTSFRFEDLLSDPEKVMRSLCCDLGIAFDRVLLKPTYVGIPAEANSSFSRRDGIDPSAIDSWRSHLGTSARRKIEKRLGPLMERLGYA
jgi:hypothetical protein